MIDYEFIRSKRKTIGITVRRDGSVVVRAPYLCSRARVDAFVESKAAWIARAQARMVPSGPAFSSAELAALRDSARAYFPTLVASVAAAMGVSYGRISFRFQKTLWGSCSRKGNLNFNCLLMLLPEEIRRYVVVHELCHLREMNHSARFWALVAQYDADYASHRASLHALGRPLMERLP